MKIAIISDTHFGDDNCTLTALKNGKIAVGPHYGDFKKAVGNGNDFLVLAGDILDFSIASYEKAYKYAQFFLQKIREDNIAKEIIYLAGNHDADIWHIIQHQRAVINRIQNRNLPETFEHSIAGIIDDRKASPQKGFTLNKITPKKERGKPKYGGMFLDKITEPETLFNFAYPNLYIVTDNESVLVTHGHYLESYWSFLGELCMKIASDDLKVGQMDVEEMIEMNFPLNQLACTGIGQAGVLTKIVRQVELDVKNGDFRKVRKYLNRLEKEIDKLTDYSWVKELAADYAVKKVKEGLLAVIEKIEQARYCEEFMQKNDVRERFRRFYGASLLEIKEINADMHSPVPPPRRVIFGHTHQPIPWNDPHAPKMDFMSSGALRRLTMHNTGGWLCERDNKFCGAEVFTYETGRGFSSSPVR